MQSIHSPRMIFCVPQLSSTESKLKWPLCFAFSYVLPITSEEQ